MNKNKPLHVARDGNKGRFTLGREGIDKLNAVEGIRLSASSRAMFADFDRTGASPEEQRRVIAAKYRKG